MSTYWNSTTGKFEPIPAAPYYVLADDPFMSFWGPSENKTNTVVVPCQTRAQAEGVRRYIASRGDMKNRRIRCHVRPDPYTLYSLYPEWAERHGGPAPNLLTGA